LLGLFLIGALLTAPAAWATGEDVREQETATKPAEDGKKEPDAAQAKDAPPAAEASETPAESPEPEAGKPGLDPGFNTIEDILAYRGSLDALWSDAPATVPEVIWRDAGEAAARGR
jgi:hypothetical protein